MLRTAVLLLCCAIYVTVRHASWLFRFAAILQEKKTPSNVPNALRSLRLPLVNPANPSTQLSKNGYV